MSDERQWGPASRRPHRRDAGATALRSPGRLLPTLVAPGAQQMGMDEALLADCGLRVSASSPPLPEGGLGGVSSQRTATTPTPSLESRGEDQLPSSPLHPLIPSSPHPSFPALRFYRWSPPCISLGRNQDPGNPRHGVINLEAARTHGADVVRRPSGGRAILHVNDLTYSLVMPAPGDDVTASHRLIARGLAAGLRRLRLDVDDGLVAMPSNRNPADCFSAAAGADLQARGRKVMGSAQRRANGALLEHGTLYLSSPEPLYSAVFGTPFGGSVVALDEALGRAVTFDEVADALRIGLEEALCVVFEAK